MGGSLFALTACSAVPDAKFVLCKAEQAIGNAKSIQYWGAGVNGNFGQTISSGAEWPRREVTSYTRTANYDQRSSSEQIVFAQDVFGGRQQNAEANGDKACNVGITLITHDSNKDYFEKVFLRPATVIRDTQGRSPRSHSV